jgi:tRNA pseudouridine55 synthase
MHGILLVDKPEGVTSSDVVRVIKRLVKPAKVGHSGTLDPAASGLLVVMIGAATRALDYLDERRKRYLVKVKLGEETDTYDREGQVISSSDPSGITLERVGEVLAHYQGVIEQVPPHFSAAKKNGVPLYKLARQGVKVDLPPRKIEIFSLVVMKWDNPFLDLDLLCSKGTYARAIARDIGRDLGVGARLETLRRTESGVFHVDDAISLDQITEGGADIISQMLIDLPAALGHIPTLRAMGEETRKLMLGSQIRVNRSRLSVESEAHGQSERLFKIVSPELRVVILVRPRPGRGDISLQTVRVFQLEDNE